jgi:hypothetical protein
LVDSNECQLVGGGTPTKGEFDTFIICHFLFIVSCSLFLGFPIEI